MKNVDKLHAVVVSTPATGFTLAQTGDASLNQMIDQVAKSDLEKAEIFGVPAALIVLVIVFGALVAAGHAARCSASSASSWRSPSPA